MADTLLTASNSPEVEAANRARELAAERANILLFSALLEGYKVGDITFMTMLKQARITLIALGISDQGRKGFLGRLVDEAMVFPKPVRGKGKPGLPIAFQKLAIALVDFAVSDGYPLALSGSYNHKKRTAYSFASKIVKGYGFKVSEDSLTKWRSSQR